MATLLAAAQIDSAMKSSSFSPATASISAELAEARGESDAYKFGSGFKRFAEVVPKNVVKLVVLSVTSVGVATALTAEFHRLVGRKSRVSILETATVAIVCGLAALVLLYVFFDYFPHESTTSKKSQ